MPRFVLLEHDHPTLHWDLMLEVGEVLWTWRLDADPCLGTPCRAIRLADHRRSYLEYEGPISGNRGMVKRVAGGEYAWIEETMGRLVISLDGQHLRGRISLERGQGEEWNLTSNWNW